MVRTLKEKIEWLVILTRDNAKAREILERQEEEQDILYSDVMYSILELEELKND